VSRSLLSIAEFRLPDDIQDVKRLFREYIAALGIDLSFQNFAEELDGLPGKYAPPDGQILIARDEAGCPVGCVAMRPLAEIGVCEMKRLYVRPEARGCDLGRRLAEAIIKRARDAGYSRMRLDTLSSMTAAQKLYASLGFQATNAYYDSPIPGTLYLALDL
jgi:GNAT superfamily N-acetyltransferase